MSKVLQPVPWGEIAYVPDDDIQLKDNDTYRDYTYGFRVGGDGNVAFQYMNGQEFTRTFSAGDEVFGRFNKILATGTTASNITLFRFLE